MLRERGFDDFGNTSCRGALSVLMISDVGVADVGDGNEDIVSVAGVANDVVSAWDSSVVIFPGSIVPSIFNCSFC